MISWLFIGLVAAILLTPAQPILYWHRQVFKLDLEKLFALFLQKLWLSHRNYILGLFDW